MRFLWHVSEALFLYFQCVVLNFFCAFLKMADRKKKFKNSASEDGYINFGGSESVNR